MVAMTTQNASVPTHVLYQWYTLVLRFAPHRSRSLCSSSLKPLSILLKGPELGLTIKRGCLPPGPTTPSWRGAYVEGFQYMIFSAVFDGLSLSKQDKRSNARVSIRYACTGQHVLRGRV